MQALKGRPVHAISRPSPSSSKVIEEPRSSYKVI
jgi:hypothetical protein